MSDAICVDVASSSTCEGPQPTSRELNNITIRAKGVSLSIFNSSQCNQRTRYADIKTPERSKGCLTALSCAADIDYKARPHAKSGWLG